MLGQHEMEITEEFLTSQISHLKKRENCAGFELVQRSENVHEADRNTRHLFWEDAGK